MELLPKWRLCWAGSRNQSLTDDLDMVDRDAAEVLWLIEQREGAK